MALTNFFILRKCMSMNKGIRGLWTSKELFIVQMHQSEHGIMDSLKSDSEDEYEKNIKTKILTASLPFVNEHGWSKKTISFGAESIGYPGVIHGMFLNGSAELVQYFYADCNAKLVDIMGAERLTNETSMKVEKSPEIYVKNALQTRLRMIIPYKSTWPQALAIMTLPPNIPNALANLLTMVDDICYYAGDRSVDFNWYTRRIVLAGIYRTTELYLLQDTSQDHKNTWEFMNRRIEDALQLFSLIRIASSTSSDQAINRAAEAANAAFITARNILGLNWNR